MQAIFDEDEGLTVDDMRELISKHKVKKIKIAYTDINGILRGQYISINYFFSVIKNGLTISDNIFNLDYKNKIYESQRNLKFKKYLKNENVIIDLSSSRMLPLEKDTMLFLCDFEKNKNCKNLCPRSLLKKTLKEATKINIHFNSSLLFDFTIFNETMQSIKDKNFENLEYFMSDTLGYSILQNSVNNEFYHELINFYEQMNIPINSLFNNIEDGSFRATLCDADILESADNAILFKTFTKVLVQKNKLFATFMKQHSHEHKSQISSISINANNIFGKSIFYDPDKKNGMSDIMRWFIGGQQLLMKDISLMILPIANSYTQDRNSKQATQASWGIQNNDATINIINSDIRNYKIEYKMLASDMNPYIALSAIIGTGIWGIKNKIEPTEMLQTDNNDDTSIELDEKFDLPTNFEQAIDSLITSKTIKFIFGNFFIDYYYFTRKYEFDIKNHTVTNWEINRYFDII